MKQTLILSTALTGLAVAAHAQDLSVVSWGGSYEASQVEAYNKPFTEKTGTRVNMVATDDPAAPLKAQVEANNVTSDVFDLAMADAIRLCDEGALLELDHDDLPPGADGTPAVDDYVAGALNECAVGNIFWGTVISFDETKFTDQVPTRAADFFDLDTFPGKRGLPRSAKRSLPLALVADGVPSDEVYDQLATPEGVDRAFAKLDTIKSDVIWWDAGAQPVQLLADGEVAMTSVYNGRIFDAIVSENKPFGVIWEGEFLEINAFVIPKAAPNPELAWDYVKFATSAEQLALQTQFISYGPARKSAGAMVGLYQDGKTEMATHLPTYPENMATAVIDDPEFWADHEAELTERLNNWLTAN
ncbi:polyamine ABC transporter substrate-binding protein [Paracoccus sp. (in: a-proteobacteria)]|uniref:polyamine ABC transporter substrate-binding protein n=1 Tax=Paracoccus sp. TaxID=267 RepID=UPI0026E03601|nr:polyamine ABC transporter substrate-binding protein [Paracoccus sp. (in: a-proteobacteria)]MDO5647411.1 polyamine ABC transporter substrate-binding protein [Paracoccus sp. (in: a-proteobacteria)]